MPSTPSSSQGSTATQTPPMRSSPNSNTLGAAFANLWGSMSSPATSNAEPSTSARRTAASPSRGVDEGTATTSGWGSVLGWGTVSGSPGGGRKRSARGSIPFDISAPLESTQSPSQSQSQSHSHPHVRTPSMQNIFASTNPSSPSTSHSQSSGPPSPTPASSALERTGSSLSGGTIRSASTARTDTGAESRTNSNWNSWLAKAEEIEKLDSHVRRIIFQAGVDHETRPMVVLAASNLPDPREVDYDQLLDRIISTMDLFVENDYTVIYFAGGATHKPGWSWIWKAYRRLTRKFRKNLKKLYIVHPTFFSRTLVQLVSTGAYFVSPKFARKIVQVPTLSALAQHVPLTQIDLPPDVLQWDLKYESTVTLPGTSGSDEQNAAGNQQRSGTRVFGVPIETLMGERGEKGGIPRVVRDCVEVLKAGPPPPLEIEGLFRRSPSSALLRAAQESYDRGHPVNLSHYRDPHIAAVLLKIFFRSLPTPIIPASLYPLISACPDPSTGEAGAQEAVAYVREVLLPALDPPCTAILLSYVLDLLHRVSLLSSINKMDANNLATVFAPNLVSSGNAIRDMMMCKVAGIGSMAATGGNESVGKALAATKDGTTLGTVMVLCIERYYEIFDQIDFEPPTYDAPVDFTMDAADDSAAYYTSVPSLSASTSATTFSSVEGEGSTLSATTSPRRGAQSTDGLTTPSESPSPAARSAPPSAGTMARNLTNTKTHATEWTATLPRRGTSHRRTGSSASAFSAFSGTSSGGGASTPTSPRTQALALSPGNHSSLDTDYSPSLRTAPSIERSSSISAGVGIGRSTSGSLRLTKGRLGSSGNLRAQATLGTTVSAPAEGLTGTTSGVALTGLNAAGSFSSPASNSSSRSNMGRTAATIATASPSAAYSGIQGQGHGQGEESSAAARRVPSRRSSRADKTRRGLSEVTEDLENA